MPGFSVQCLVIYTSVFDTADLPDAVNEVTWEVVNIVQGILCIMFCKYLHVLFYFFIIAYCFS
jgi:hypothetical protein